MNVGVKVHVTLFEILPWNLPGGTRWTRRNLREDSVVTQIQTRHFSNTS